MFVSAVDWVQYTSQESYRGIQFSEDGFLPVEGFSPLIILRIP